MAAPPEAVKCPHCRKTFLPSLMGPGTKREGYKCPHCNLFMPLSRSRDADAA